MNIVTEAIPQTCEGKYEVISREFFSRRNDPNVRFSRKSFRFNQEAVNALEQAEHISVFINEAERKLIVRPASGNTGPGSKWTYASGKQIRPQTIASASFMKKLYEAMGWFPEYDYRAIGTAVQTQCGPMLLFGLDDTEMIV